MDLFALRQKHPSFAYRGFKAKKKGKDLLLSFDLKLEPNIKFKPTLRFKNLTQEIFEKVNNDPNIENLFHHLGIAEIPSYWKTTCSPEIKIEYPLSTKQIEFWQDLLLKGMGEFYFKNKIDFTSSDFVKVTALATQSEQKVDTEKQSTSLENQKLLVPVGGGKDSATVLGILEEKGLEYDILLLSPLSPAAEEIAWLMKNEGHCQRIIKVERKIDPKLLQLNQRGYLNGHTPFSAYLAFLSSTVAYLYGHDLIILSNEASADEENTIFHGQKINHQYSKSSEFERKFQTYAQKFLFANTKHSPYYFSLLRPLSELEITKTLVQLSEINPKFEEILSIFRSCNVGQKQGIWCHHCSKCAFVFTMLSAYLNPKFVSTKIFDENLFDKKALRETFFELAGFRDKKPFECVGTFDETKEAISLAVKQYKKNKTEMPKTLKDLHAEIKKTRMGQDEKV